MKIRIPRNLIISHNTLRLYIRLWEINANQEDKSEQVFIYIALALLFQPFYKIALGRELWNIVDVAVGVALLASILLDKKRIN